MIVFSLTAILLCIVNLNNIQLNFVTELSLSISMSTVLSVTCFAFPFYLIIHSVNGKSMFFVLKYRIRFVHLNVNLRIGFRRIMNRKPYSGHLRTTQRQSGTTFSTYNFQETFR